MRRFGCALLFLFALAAVAQNVPVPYISQPLSPTTVLPGSQGFTLTLHGANFAPSAVLEWNGSQRPTVVVSSNVLQATINTSDLTTANFIFVSVVNLGSNPQTSNTALFTIRKPAPAVALSQDPYFSDSGYVATVGDFNGDGQPDIATCSPNNGRESVINVYLGQGRNKFGAPIKTIATDIINCVSLFTGDFNGDQLLDLAVIGGDKYVVDKVAVWFGDGKGKFTQGPVTETSNSVRWYGIADFDGDGFLDLLGVDRGYPFVLFGTGGGNFGPSTAIFARRLDGNLVFGDFNEDGYLDVAFHEAGGAVRVALNQGNKTFLLLKRSYSLPCGSIATADVNNDGHLDIVDCTGAVLLGKGNGTFTNGVGSTVQSSEPPVIADFNGDGKMDVLFVSPTSGLYPLILLGNGDGTFQPPAPAGPLGLGFLDLSDFNSDGHLALVGSRVTGMSVYRQVPAGLYPGMLTYGPQVVGTSSQPQTANLYNAGSTPLNLTSIKIGGTNPNDFTQTNNCPTSIPVGGGCQIQVTFMPTAVGNWQAELVVAYKGGLTSPQSVALTGQGVGGVSVSLTPSNLTFATQLVKTTSAPQTATLTNTGSADVTINSIGTSRPFSQTNNCPSTLPVGQSCQIQVTFYPTQKGQANGTLSVSDNASDSPQKVALSGVGTILTFKPIGVNFGNQKVGTHSRPAAFTFSNLGTVALNISSIALGGANPGDFSQTNNCPSSLAAGGHCTIQVTFTPTQTGARSAELQVSDDAIPSPQQAGVGGTGT
jgi:hypothetical protein